MPREPLRIISQRILVVEGEDDRRFFRAFIKHHGLAGFQVIPMNGRTSLRAALRALRSAPGVSEVTGLAIARDADDDAAGTFQSVADALRSAGLPVPEAPFAVCRGKPNTLILIIAGVEGTGSIEDL